MENARADEQRGGWPQNVGICALEIYFPRLYVRQSELEVADNVPGKYTKGLEQEAMGFCDDLEDVNSLCLTVVQNLLERTGISPNQVGRLEVGTETILDKSKSVKSVLMQLFAEGNNHNIEGIDTTNACYGGTAALFNAVNWIESSSWDGRYAIVVAGDIAVYPPGPARCTGGVGAVAMLIGANAPLALERGLRGIHMEHVYDFYKANLSSEYPEVDGAQTLKCYLRALDSCYADFCQKAARVQKAEFSLDDADYVLFHSPYTKMVRKSLGRLLLADLIRRPSLVERYPDLAELQGRTLVDTVGDRSAEQLLLKASSSLWQTKTDLSTLTGRCVGNMYTASLYGCLASLLAQVSSSTLSGKRVLLYSYGSGLASSLYSLRCHSNADALWSLSGLNSSLSALPERLSGRTALSVANYTECMLLREKRFQKSSYTPTSPVDRLWPGTFYLVEVDDKWRRRYSRTPSPGSTAVKGSASLPNGTTNL